MASIKILGVHERAFNSYEAFILITVISSTKLICFWRNYQKSLKIAEYPAPSIIDNHLVGLLCCHR